MTTTLDAILIVIEHRMFAIEILFKTSDFLVEIGDRPCHNITLLWMQKFYKTT